ncbi:putative glutamine ABC transporter permease protein GlnP [Methylobacterium adhaesivum]|uniref:Amino acid ABC transporter permease n=1 Tax=Methylobacterium adhaesivum TaxID=333297 RepID=A0ABT8BJA9_9HYPH|nr:amino acid ABC transporter permease [Methylobacterium adhaesivum]MDN3591345.1 amino acid ABC transporter permease [Methylobacterium adhaesivum]GJD30048.1 putative glutamine ABC transporter permease protein GlnP [Methylobacterium adhaesivum]
MTWPAIRTILDGAVVTAMLAAVSILLSLPLGLLLALLRWRRVPVLAGALAAFVSLVRATPFITLVLFVFFILPSAGIQLDPVPAAILALTINTAAFSSEIWRAALQTFSRDQREAAAAFGLSERQIFTRIVFPQIWRANLGPLISEVTILLKCTPAVAVIGVVEITRAAGRVGAETYEPLPPFLVATLIYTALIATLVRGQRVVERRIARRYGVTR